jgi:hypothetical protein
VIGLLLYRASIGVDVYVERQNISLLCFVLLFPIAVVLAGKTLLRGCEVGTGSWILALYIIQSVPLKSKPTPKTAVGDQQEESNKETK